MLTPAAIDPALPFPHVTNLVLYLAVRLEKSGEEDKLAIVQLPRAAARWIQVAGRDEVRFVLLEDVVREHIGELFGGHTVAEAVAFRVTRDADFATDDQEAEDLVDAVRQVLRSRLAGDPVRLEIEEGASDALVERLAGALGIGRGRCLPVAGAARSQIPHRLRAHSDAAGSARGGVDASAAARHPAGRRDLGRDRRAGHPALSSLREFRAGAPVAAARRGGSRRHGDQADALPDLVRLRGGAGPGARGGEREAGHGSAGASGAVRRGAKRHVGAKARGSGRAGSLRAGGAQDPRQGAPDRAPRGGRGRALRARRDGELQRAHGARLLRLESAHRGRRAVRRPDRVLQRGDGVLRAAAMAADRDGAAGPAPAAPGLDSPRGGEIERPTSPAASAPR